MRKIWIVTALLLLVSLCCAALAEGAIIDGRTTQSFTDEPVSEEDLRAILEAGLAATSALNQQPWYFAVITNQEVMDELKGGFGGAPGGFAGAPGNRPEGAPEGFDGAPEGFDGAPGDMPEGERPAPPQGGGMPAGGAKAGLGDSPVAIVVYMDGNTKSPSASFDCGLACENMFIAAKSLGYGAKIVSSPTMQLNGEDHDALCEKLGVDTSCEAVAVLLIGHEDDSVDATSGASARSAIEEKVSFVE